MAHRIDLHVGKRLRQRRWMAGLTQSQLAAFIAPRSARQIGMYECGKSSIAIADLCTLAEALGVPISYFFLGLETTASPCEAAHDAIIPANGASPIRLAESDPPDPGRTSPDPDVNRIPPHSNVIAFVRRADREAGRGAAPQRQRAESEDSPDE